MIKPGSQPYKCWVALRKTKTSIDDITWEEFIEAIQDALGSKEACKAKAYYDYQEVKWDPAKQSIMDFY